ncbi:exsB protein, partial [mine drainage metagenome]
FRVEAPLLRLSKAQIVRLGERFGVPWALTWSCYAGGDRPCGRCDSCRLRARGFRGARRVDPTVA